MTSVDQATPPSPPGSSGGPTASFRAAHRRLRTAQKPSRGISFYSRYVNRPVGRVLASVAYVAGLTPNAVTLISAAVTAVAYGLITLVHPSIVVGLGCYLLAMVGFALDSADGQLARLRGGGSPTGEWLDHIADCAKMVGIHSAVIIALYRFFDVSVAVLTVGVAFQLLAVVMFFAGILTEQLHRQHPAVAVRPAREPSTMRALALVPVDYGVFCIVLAVLGWRAGFIGLYCTLFAAQAIVFPAMLMHWWRELQEM